MEERREIIQTKIYDENGDLEYTIIPNYTKTDYFMSENEINFYKVLKNIITIFKEKYDEDLQIFAQVALNRIIRQNNRREEELEKNIFAKSIDYVLYNNKTNEIKCCIELDGIEHYKNDKKIKRDKKLNKALEEANIKILHQQIQKNYNEDYIIDKIINLCKEDDEI